MIQLEVIGEDGMVLYRDRERVPEHTWWFRRLTPFEVRDWINAKKEEYRKTIQLWKNGLKADEEFSIAEREE